MTRPIRSIATAVAAALVVAFGAAIPADAPALADDCLAGPKWAAPQGSHWYYRLDRNTRRKCWYLGVQGQKTQRAAPQAAKRTPPVVEWVAALNADRADGPIQGEPQGSPASAPGDRWQADAPQRPDPPNRTDTLEQEGAMLERAMLDRAMLERAALERATLEGNTLGISSAQAPATPDAGSTDGRNSGRAAPPPVAAIREADPATDRALHMPLLIAGALGLAGLVLSGTLKRSASAQPRRSAKRHDAERIKVVAPKWAPSIFDIRDVPPLPPIGRIEPSVDTRDLLWKLLRETERRPGAKVSVR